MPSISRWRALKMSYNGTFTPGSASKSKAQASNGPTKKLVIKPLKLKPQLPSDFEATTWDKLKDAIAAVHQKRPVACSLEELYTAVENMCVHKMAETLYTKLQGECEGRIAKEIERLQENVVLDPVTFLDRVDAMWQDHCNQMLMIRSIFLYLDRTYVITSGGVRSLFDMGLQLLRKHLLLHDKVLSRLVEGLLQLVMRERQGEAVERRLLASLLRMLLDVSLYEEFFQRPFLQQTEAFYREEGDRLLAELSVPDYLLHCESRLSQEYERVTQYLDVSTRKALVTAVERQLVARHVAALLDKGLALLMDAQRVADLARLYALTARVAATEALRAAFKDYVRDTGLRIVKDEEKDKDMVERLLELKSRLDALMEGAFGRSEAFANSLKEAFEHLINARQNKPAELIAKFIDAQLRAGNKGVAEDETEALLDQALMLFRYIQGKDVFEAFYKKDLAKRLLLGKSASTDAEKSMIGKLKAECGSQFTNKLEGMFKDIDLSKEVMNSVKESMRSAPPSGSSAMETSVTVLTSGYWPTYPLMEAKLPKELSESQELFREQYLRKYSGRRLVWQNSLGTCIVRANFPAGPKELSVSLLQAVVLMLFNDAARLSLEEVRQQSGIEDKELRRTLQSLACGKVRVLTKEPRGRDVNSGDTFRFNESFTERRFRLAVNTIQLKETSEENAKTNDEVMQDRQYQIDAALVRIMKTRKNLSHKLLVQEVLQQLKFPLRAADLKRRIESLIDREYLQRDPKDANIYNYLA